MPPAKRNPRKLTVGEILQGDDLALQMVRDAEARFEKSAADRHLIRNVRKTSAELAQALLEQALTKGIDESGASFARSLLSNMMIDRKYQNVSAELAQVYANLGLIRDWSNKSILLDCPQSLVDPVMLRAFAPALIEEAGERLHSRMNDLTDRLRAVQAACDMPANHLNAQIAEEYVKRSAPLLLRCQSLNATKVYFTGPLFYGNAEKGWTVTFATGSGLPDPHEWHGSLWFKDRYRVSNKRLKDSGYDKNPFRSINFSVGVANQRWGCRRLYVWQRSKTAAQMASSLTLATLFGRRSRYLFDAINQLVEVFQTPRLKIIELPSFSPELTMWTRISPQDVMISCRPGTSEAKIEHALWLTPGVRLTGAVIKGFKRTAEEAMGVIAGGAALLGGHLEATIPLTWLARLSTTLLLDRMVSEEEERLRREIVRLQEVTEKLFEKLWSESQAGCIVKQPDPLTPSDALRAAILRVSSLTDLAPEEVAVAWKRVRSQRNQSNLELVEQ
jgi:hypothetical protein